MTRVRYAPEGRALFCHANVVDKVDSDGGERVRCWLMLDDGISITGSAHSVWQAPETHELVDITPFPGAVPFTEAETIIVRTEEEASRCVVYDLAKQVVAFRTEPEGPELEKYAQATGITMEDVVRKFWTVDEGVRT